MSIDSTKQAMGYVGFTESRDNCNTCGQSRLVDQPADMAVRAPNQVGLKCAYGGFFTVRKASCKRFEQKTCVPIGPLNV